MTKIISIAIIVLVSGLVVSENINSPKFSFIDLAEKIKKEKPKTTEKIALLTYKLS